MTWTNAFDLGACTVKVASAINPTTLFYSGVMAKGDTHAFAGGGSESFTVSVSSLGVVTLANANTGIGIEADMLVIVAPSYSLVTMVGAQVLAAKSCVGKGSAGATSNLNDTTVFDSTSGPVNVDLTTDTPYEQLFVETSMINGSQLTPIIQFTPEFEMPNVVIAPDESLVAPNNEPVSVTPDITLNGSPVTPDSMHIVTGPLDGNASVSGGVLTYTPNITFSGSDSFTYTATVGGTVSNQATVTVSVYTNYNCDCDDAFPTATLAQLRQRMVVRLGYAALLVAPPGLVLLLNDFLTQAQTLLYRKYSCFRTRRWFTWNMVQGGRFYDFGGNVDVCAKVLDPRKVEWVGISKGDVNWTELICGINPVMYRSMQQAIPQFYDIRQCIEVWPAPNSDEWQLRIKGDFGLLPFVADSDVTTIDVEAIFLLALANAKAHYEQPDAGTTMAMATGLIADLTSGSHFTRRYVPGVTTPLNAVPPLMKP
jgi:hypothetical protein